MMKHCRNSRKVSGYYPFYGLTFMVWTSVARVVLGPTAWLRLRVKLTCNTGPRYYPELNTKLSTGD
jgi:hypothetical protein